MTKAQWQAHRAEVGPHDAASCEQCKARLKTKRAASNRRIRADVMRSCGLVRVVGSVSGRTYWE